MMRTQQFKVKYKLSEAPISFWDKVNYYVIKITSRFPLIKSIFFPFFKLICNYISTTIKKGNLNETYRMITLCLESKYYKKQTNEDKWWFFMRIAVSCLQQEQLQRFIIRPNLEDKLIALGQTSPHSYVGYDTSYCFVAFALWAFERGLTGLAVEFAKIARDAYSKWGYPDYLIGWFSLFFNQTDSVEHFCKAIGKDWNMLHRIRHDPTCNMFPDIVKKVSRKVLIFSNKQQ